MFSDCDLYLCTSRLLESNSWSLTYDPSFYMFCARISKAESDFYSCVFDLEILENLLSKEKLNF